ncbi:phytoene/squalene synthase family protein [Luteimonas aestuarii]|uniref:Phytoene/squalene synthase family protein n=1 Tax=Luteimonas aestuarii TaxID=453837 RepID=A0A4R5TV74_9GAMM|nr:phytoene/squalene synthase family protein [Luteimonas aestuarii]TDK24940.1 phytoene/squalene synthase family protein [Luteimonas aestuarii]
MNDSASLASFIDKWRQRWPEWALVAVFVPVAQRQRVAAWFALLQELRDAAWRGSDPAPGLAKLAWWQEELRGWSRGARRHPLGDTLQKLDAPWGVLASSLSALPATRRPASADDDASALESFASAVLACEAALFDGPAPTAEDIAALAACERIERALEQGETAPALPQVPPHGRATSMTGPRRLQRVVLRERLRMLAKHPSAPARMPALRLLFAGWRAARGA